MLNRLSTLLHRAAYSIALVVLLSACSDNSSKEQIQNVRPLVTIVGTNAVLEKQSVTLNANASDPDGTISTYKWTQSSGPAVAIGSDNASVLSFDLPNFDANTDLVFSVTVSDNAGAISSSSFTLSVQRISDSIELQGMVVDEPLANAVVTFSAGDDGASANTDTQGNYSLVVEIDEKNYDELILVTAVGDSSTHLGVKLISQLPTIASLKALAGDDGVVSVSDTLAVNVTNVSTAKLILVEEANGNQPAVTEQQLQDYIAALDKVKVYELAAAIKIIVDNENYNLPNDVVDTLAYFKDVDKRAAFFVGVASNAPTLLNSVIQNIIQDQNVVGEVANNDDLDDDGAKNDVDAFVLDASETVDTDADGVGNNADTDDDNDAVDDTQDAFPLDALESVDTDADGIGNNADTDDDNDTVQDVNDVFPLDNSESTDTDSDGVGNNADTDDDNDTVEDTQDTFPLDASESVDTDADGTGNNADTDDDNDTVQDVNDVFPLDSSESTDTDSDGVGNNADTDDDNDTVEDTQDTFPLDASESVDTDADGTGNNADTDDDNDTVLDVDDVFPLDDSESTDTDLDGVGNNADTDDDNDTVVDSEDAFPFDATETIDTDSDGLGNNADIDDDNDLVTDEIDGYPLIAIGDLPDTDNDGIPDDCDTACQELGMEADDDDNGNGVLDDDERTAIVVAIDTPQSLITVGTSPVTVTGTVSLEASVYLNGVEVDNNNGIFEGDVTLSEGSNSIEARAIVNDEINTDLITVSLDKTPPYLTIDSYQDNQTVYESIITITGLVNDIVRGTVEEDQANVTVNGVSASIKNRSYSARDVNLTQGPNQITIEASDQVGNTSTLALVINYTELVGNKIELVSGQNQTGSINQALVEPLLVKVIDQNAQAMANQAVVFRVIQGSGEVGAGTANQGRAVVVDTDAEGMAATEFVLGSRTGVSNHKVSASVVGITGSLNFNANAQGLLGNKLSVNSGNNQRGIVFNNLPEPFVTVVTDGGANVVEGARVRFDVIEGNGTFANGGSQITVETDSDGRAISQYKLGNKIGLDTQRVQATLLDAQDAKLITAGFTSSAFAPVLGGNTTITGVVLDNQDDPIVNVTVRIEDSTREAITDDNGQFVIEQAPVGPVHLIADGSTVTDGSEYPALSYNIVTIAGTENPLSAPIYMVKLDTENAVFAGPEDVILTMPQFPGFTLEIGKDSVTFPDGSRDGLISVTSVNASKVPMAPPNGMQPQFIVTIQPSGTMFDPPARLSLPNVDAHPPGAQVEMYSYDHDLEEFVSIGLGTASEDGSVVESNAGVGVVKAGWHCGSQPQGSGCCGGGGNGGGGCPSCNKREGATCEDGGCVPDNGQDPGDCKKCSGGSSVNDDSETPTGPNGKCEKCEGGSPAPDASKNDSKCSTIGNQACYTCKDGKCDNNCDADPDKHKLSISSGDIAGLDSLVDKLKNAGRFLPGPLDVVAASAALSLDGSIESGEKCCKECTPGKPLKSPYNKYQGDYKIETSMKIGLKASAADVSSVIPFTVTRIVLKYEIGPFLEIKGGIGNSISYETSDCEEGNCITVSVTGTLGAQLSVGGSLQLGYDKFDRLKCPLKNISTEAQNENTNCFGPYNGAKGELWATGGSGIKAEIAVSQCPGGDKCGIELEKVAGKIFAKATIELDFFKYEYEDVLKEGTLFEGSSASCL
jgi:hypothetical protein